MNGQNLKKILTSKGYLLKDVAAKLGLTQPNFSQIVKAQDVKSGTLENICDVLGVTLDFFYEGTKYVDLQGRNKTVADNTSNYSPDLIKQLGEKDKEISFLKGKIEVLENVNEMLVNNKPYTPSDEVNLHQKHA